MSIIKILDTWTYLKRFSNQPKFRLIANSKKVNGNYCLEYGAQAQVQVEIDSASSDYNPNINWTYRGNISQQEANNNIFAFQNFTSPGDTITITATTDDNLTSSIEFISIYEQISSKNDIDITTPSTAMQNIENQYLISIKQLKDGEIYNGRCYYIYNNIEYPLPSSTEGDSNISMSPGGVREDGIYIWEDTYITFKNIGNYKFVFYCENIYGDSFEVSSETEVEESYGKIVSIYCPEGGYSFSHKGETKTIYFDVEYDNPNASSFETLTYEYSEHPSGVYKVISSTKDSVTIECTGAGSADLYVYSVNDYYMGCSVTVEFLHANITDFIVQPTSIDFSDIGERIFVAVTPIYNDDNVTSYEKWGVDLPGSSVWEIAQDDYTDDGFWVTCIGEGSDSIYVCADEDMSVGISIPVFCTIDIPDAPDEPIPAKLIIEPNADPSGFDSPDLYFDWGLQNAVFEASCVCNNPNDTCGDFNSDSVELDFTSDNNSVGGGPWHAGSTVSVRLLNPSETNWWQVDESTYTKTLEPGDNYISINCTFV